MEPNSPDRRCPKLKITPNNPEVLTQLYTSKEAVLEGFIKELSNPLLDAIVYLPLAKPNTGSSVDQYNQKNIIGIKEVTKNIGNVNRRKVLICRVISRSIRHHDDISVLIDDPQGREVTRLELNNLSFNVPSLHDAIMATRNLPVGCILAIKDPLFTSSYRYTGLAVICNDVDLVEDVSGYVLRQLRIFVWEGSIPEEFLPDAIDVGEVEFKSIQTQQQRHQKYRMIKAAYKRGEYVSAFGALDLLLQQLPNFPSAQYTKAMIYCQMRLYLEALSYLMHIRPMRPGRADEYMLGCTKQALANRLNGVFDILDMTTKSIKYIEGVQTFIEYPDYINPKVLRKPLHDRTGLGCEATFEIHPGEIVMAGRAYALFVPEESQLPVTEETVVNALTAEVLRLVKEMPHTSAEILAYYRGPQPTPQGPKTDPRLRTTEEFGVTPAEEERIRWVCRVHNQRANDTSMVKEFYYVPYYPGAIRHSCTANCYMFNIGGFVFVKASKYIPPGTEVTRSYWDPKMEYKAKEELWEKFEMAACDCEICELDMEEKPEVHEKRNVILTAAKPHVEAQFLTDEGVDVLRNSLEQLEQMRTSRPELNIHIDSIMVRLVNYYRRRGIFDKCLALSLKGYYLFVDSGLNLSLALYCVSLVVSYSRTSFAGDWYIWKERLETLMKRDYDNPLFQSIGEILIGTESSPFF